MTFRNPLEAAATILAACQNRSRWEPAALELLIRENPAALFSHVIEPLSDAFEPAYCDTYADLFCEVIAGATGLDALALRQRYEGIRRPARFAGDAEDVCVLSRVTLGADLAVTSVFLDAAKRRFPLARIYFVGPAKNYEMFDADLRVRHIAAPYARHGGLAERIAAGIAIGGLLPHGSLLLDPDSRLSQLGLLPMAPADRHLFFESRSVGGISTDSMTTLAKRWAAEVLGVADATNFASPKASPAAPPAPGLIAVSLGTGENPAKRVADPFESELINALAATGRPILADLGAGGEEESRVRKAIAAAAPSSRRRIDVYKGSFASFAASIAASTLYVGYDSSGQHAAAVFGIPRLTVFAGYPNERFLARWRPDGKGQSHTVLATAPGPAIAAFNAALAALI